MFKSSNDLNHLIMFETYVYHCIITDRSGQQALQIRHPLSGLPWQSQTRVKRKDIYIYNEYRWNVAVSAKQALRETSFVETSATAEKAIFRAAPLELHHNWHNF